MTVLADVADHVRSTLPDLLREHHVPGAAVALVSLRDGEWAGAFGSTRASGGRAVTPHTMFGVQSVSKTLTAAAVIRGVHRGLLALDEPVTRALPWLTVNSVHEERAHESITLTHLLSHTAGLTHEAPVGNNWAVGRRGFDDHVASIARTWLRCRVGGRYEYSNLGIDLAAAALAAAAGGAFVSVAAALLLDPLGTSRTTFDQALIARSSARARGHAPDGAAPPLKVPMVAAGGAYSTAGDLARFVRCMLQHPDERMQRVPFPLPGQIAGYGLGVASSRRHGPVAWGHSGGGFGFLSDMYWIPEAGVGAVVLTNATGHPLQGSYAGELLRMLAGSTPPARFDPRPAVRLSAAARRAISGHYVGRSEAFDIEAARGGLQLRAGERAFHVDAVSDTDLRVFVDGHEFNMRAEAGCLRSLEDGSAWLRTALPADGAAVVHRFDEVVHGRRTGGPRVLDDGGRRWFGPWGPARALALHEHVPGLWFSSTGEALDMRGRVPTYASVALRRA